MKTADHPVLEYVEDKKLIEMMNFPKEICEKYKINYITIGGVVAQKEGNRTSFLYQGDRYSRVELVAKRYYESLGYLSAWNEGASFTLVNVAVGAEMVKRLAHLIEFNGGTYYSDVHKDTYSLENMSDKGWHLLQKFISSDLSNINHFDKTGIHALYKTRDELINALICVYKVDPHEFLSQAEVVFGEMIKSPLLNLNDYKVHMEAYIAERVRNSRGRPDQNLNEWAINHALKLIEVMGLDEFSPSLLKRCSSYSSIIKFDLSLVDVKNKKLKFAEVKNKDGFTPFQIVSLDEWLRNRNATQAEFEVCFVNPKL